MNIQTIQKYSKLYHAHRNLWNRNLIKYWRCMLLNRPRQNGSHLSDTRSRMAEHSKFAWTTANWTQFPLGTLIPYSAWTNASTLRDATSFSAFCGDSSYWQVEVANGDRYKTTFSPRNCIFGWIKLPFSLKPHSRRFNTDGHHNYIWLGGRLHWFILMISTYFHSHQTEISISYDNSWHHWTTLVTLKLKGVSSSLMAQAIFGMASSHVA